MQTKKEHNPLGQPPKTPSSAICRASSLPHRMKDALLSLFYPQGNLCHACDQPMLTGTEHLLCEDCQQLLNASALTADGQPFSLGPWLPTTYAAFWHEGPARTLVHQLKYNSDLFAAIPLCEGMARLWAKSCDGSLHRVDLLVPVPLHPKRERMRGYNQAQILGAHLATHTGLTLAPEALQRIRHTGRQVGNTRASRLSNMHGAFAVKDESLVRGKCILLLDDVCTTGATAASCAKALLAAGAAQVLLFTVCKA